MARCRRLAPDGVVSSGKFVRKWSCPLGEKDQDSRIGEVVERYSTQGIELKETHTQRVPQRRHMIHGGESEFRETNPCVSFVVCLTTHFSSFTLCFRFDLLGCIVSVCAETWNILYITCRGTTPSYICARVKEGRNSNFGQVLHRTSLTGLHNRSDRLPFVFCG